MNKAITEKPASQSDSRGDGSELNRRELVAGSGVVALAAGVGMQPVTAATAPSPLSGAPRSEMPIRFSVNGKAVALEIDSRASLLDTLRERLNLTGAKKGCDHGQCGACTVHLDGQRVASCLTMVAQANGRDVTTIEGIGRSGQLHPMQQAFIDHDALQCGYCTPGQIMAAIACVREGHAKSADQIREYMSGNICRCGAYVGIVAAIQDAARQPGGFEMRPFTYLKVETPAAAVKAMADAVPGTRFLAGGTTLYDLMKLAVMSPPAVIDITGMRELSTFNTTGNELQFGALAPMSKVAEDPRLMLLYPALAESLWKAASQQLRNMASVGGNLLQRTRCAYFRGGDVYPCNKRNPGSGCAAMEGADRGQALLGASEACNAVYPGDWAVALTAFSAQVDTISPRGTRTLAVEELFLEPGTTPDIETRLTPDELVTRIRVPASSLGRASTYHKIRDRESYAFALTSAAVALQMEGDVVRDARIALGGVATRPWRVRKAEQELVGQTLTPALARRVGEVALEGARAGRHNGFRIELGARTVADALFIAKKRAGAA